jgi:putative peptidoglycan lipid II flippase
MPEGGQTRGSKEGRSLWRAAGLISIFTMFSRVLGLLREQASAALLGAGLEAQAFLVAFRIPNLLRDLFAEGALSAAFVPTYTRRLQEGGPEAANRLGSRLLSVLMIVMALLVLAGVLGAGAIVRVLAPGFEPEKAELTIRLTRIMLPFLPLVSFAALAMGMLNARERFGPPALAPAMFNVVTILGAAVLWGLGLSPYAVAVGWSIATLLGGLAQLLIQLPPLMSTGWRFRFEWAPADPDVRHIGRLMGPATLGMAAVQVNTFFSTIFASYEDGAVAWLQYAFRLLYLPVGVFGVAVGTVAATGVAKQVAAGDLSGLAATLQRSLRSLAFLTAPSTLGLMVLATPIVRLLFEHGKFAERVDNTANTATALAITSASLMAYCSVKVMVPAFYALGRPRVPVIASALAVAANLLTMFALHTRFGFRGVALGLVASTLVNAFVLGVVLHRRVGSIAGPGLAGFLARVGGATLVMGLVSYFTAQALEDLLGTHGLLRRAVIALVPIALGAVSYFGLAYVFGITEARSLLAALRRRRP